MRTERSNLTGAFKAKVSLEALQEKKTIAQPEAIISTVCLKENVSLITGNKILTEKALIIYFIKGR